MLHALDILGMLTFRQKQKETSLHSSHSFNGCLSLLAVITERFYYLSASTPKTITAKNKAFRHLLKKKKGPFENAIFQVFGRN